MSQLDLAAAAGVSQRHLSFLETGRSRPSREMVIHLAMELDVPPREQNRLLATAGHSAQYPETSLTDSGLGRVRRVLETILASHEPFPAIVVDRGWNVVLANEAALRFTTSLLDPGGAAPGAINAVKLVLGPDGVRSRIVNWRQVATAVLRRLDREIASRPTDDVLRRLWDEVLVYPDVADVSKPGSTDLVCERG